MLKLKPTIDNGVPRFSPWGLAASGTESGEQQAFFCWANRAMWCGFDEANDIATWHPDYYTTHARPNVNDPATMALPDLRWLHSIPNGGARSPATAGVMKAEGVKAGVADIFLPKNRGEHPGLYIELKRKNGVASDFKLNQLDFARFVRAEGYAWAGCYGWVQARDALMAYANRDFTKWYDASDGDKILGLR